ncbi:hypothetical protein PI124_g9828 [Phytophthora idaei]|nr:hypothetical protein PI125_g9470 [Phytophthora idaei]KAG3155062.1 hypothetical protein PI126_g9334 [Phytophthora idaei]KAG3245433.1 hypothetical protein PI124_g9828 [Phytophthora idaei]
MPPKQQRTFLTNAQKLQLKQFWSEHPDLQLLAVVDWVRKRFGVSVGRATLYRIYHAPIETFAGNAQKKKGRRVKFPALEKDILAFYEENRQLGDSNGLALSDEALLRAAAELRARHGISETELKLSNGWLHRFKERHALRIVPHATGDKAATDATQTVTDGASEATQIATEKPKRKPRAPRRRKTTNQLSAQILQAECDIVGSIEGPDEADTASNNQPLLVTGDNASNALEDTAAIATVNIPTAAIQPLTYLSAVAAHSVAAVGFVRWKLHGGMAHEDLLSVDNDAVAVLRTASYQINVELHHSSSPPRTSAVIFKVWAGVEMLGQCEHSVRSEGGRTLSVQQLECTLSAQTVIRVEYHAPGVVYNDSRLVLRLLDVFA